MPDFAGVAAYRHEDVTVERDRYIGYISRNGTGIILKPVERCDSGDADQTACRQQADQGAGS